MNIAKINGALNRYMDAVKDTPIPDVYDLFIYFGREYLGRNVFNFGEVVMGEEYFNKSIVPKAELNYIGKPFPSYYSQEIIDTSSDNFEEYRILVVKGTPNRMLSKRQQEIVDLIMDTFFIDNFVIDFWNDLAIWETYVMELNEIHLSSITQRELGFILKMIL